MPGPPVVPFYLRRHLEPKVARASMLLCGGIMSALAAILFVAAGVLVGIFDVPAGTPLEALSVEWMHVLGYAMVPASINIALIGLLQGSGATRTSLRINIWSTLLVQLPLAYILGFVLDLGATGVWWSFPLG